MGSARLSSPLPLTHDAFPLMGIRWQPRKNIRRPWASYRGGKREQTDIHCEGHAGVYSVSGGTGDVGPLATRGRAVPECMQRDSHAAAGLLGHGFLESRQHRQCVLCFRCLQAETLSYVGICVVISGLPLETLRTSLAVNTYRCPAFADFLFAISKRFQGLCLIGRRMSWESQATRVL